jgi:hypothetical protein
VQVLLQTGPTGPGLPTPTGPGEQWNSDWNKLECLGLITCVCFGLLQPKHHPSQRKVHSTFLSDSAVLSACTLRQKTAAMHNTRRHPAIAACNTPKLIAADATTTAAAATVQGLCIQGSQPPCTNRPQSSKDSPPGRHCRCTYRCRSDAYCPSQLASGWIYCCCIH